MPYILGTDVWEGQKEIEEAIFDQYAPLIIVRLNDMNGGHHMDAGFAKQWAEAGAAGMLRAIYFVYNPWVDGVANARWLLDHLPAGPLSNIPNVGPKRVFIDVEVRYPGYSAVAYGADLAIFLRVIKGAGYIPSIYTGGWFLDVVSPWPADCDYWWAQYPASMYPTVRTNITWDALTNLANKLVWPPANYKNCPGPLKLWQCTGDRWIVPGNTMAIDLNLWPGTMDELVAWIGPAFTPPLTLDQKVDILWKAHPELHPGS